MRASAAFVKPCSRDPRRRPLQPVGRSATGTGPSAGHGRSDVTPAIETLVRRFYDDLWNRFDVRLIPILLTEDVTVRGALGRHAVGHAAFADYLELVRNAFPDFQQTVEEVEVDAVGGSAFVRLRCRGTHRGALLGLPATGRRIAYAGATRLETRGGRIADIWILGDLQSLVRQLKTERR